MESTDVLIELSEHGLMSSVNRMHTYHIATYIHSNILVKLIC